MSVGIRKDFRQMKSDPMLESEINEGGGVVLVANCVFQNMKTRTPHIVDEAISERKISD